MMSNDALIVNLVKRLRLITESAWFYIEDGKYLDQLNDDIRLAREVLEQWDEAYPDTEED